MKEAKDEARGEAEPQTTLAGTGVCSLQATE